jgi:two-component system sensor histidine kinase YesM
MKKRIMKIYSEWFYKMKTIQRLWFFYTVFFLFPLSIWTVFYFFQLHRNITNNFQRYYSDAITNMAVSYNDHILRIANTVELFEGNRYFIDYVEDWNMPVAERVSSFNSDIRPLVNYVLSSNNLLENVIIYSYRSIRIPPYYFIDAWTDGFLPRQEIDSLGPHQTAWQFSINPDGTGQLLCYFPVYRGNYSSQAGCVVLSVNIAELLDPFQRESQNLEAVLVTGGKEYAFHNGIFNPVHDGDSAIPGNSPGMSGNVIRKIPANAKPVRELSLRELDASLYFFADLRYFSGGDIPALLIPIISLLILLTSIMFINFAAGTRRVSALARHFQNMDYRNLTPLDRGNYTDEIGFLVDCYNKMAENINHLIHDVYRAELKSRDARYYAIQAQINPHFLLNSLENIRMIAMLHGDDETSGMIYQLARIMNYTIKQSDLISTLSQETDHCRNYLELCAMRMGFRYTIACPGELAGLVCPKFMLQPIVENAIEHAFVRNPPEKQIDISVSPRGADACIMIRDNGCGMEKERLTALRSLLKGTSPREENQKEIHGIGIVNVHERLKIFYGAEYGITVESSPETGTVFTLFIGSRPYTELEVEQSGKGLWKDL